MYASGRCIYWHNDDLIQVIFLQIVLAILITYTYTAW